MVVMRMEMQGVVRMEKNAMYSEDSASIVAHLLYTLNPN